MTRLSGVQDAYSIEGVDLDTHLNEILELRQFIKVVGLAMWFRQFVYIIHYSCSCHFRCQNCM